MREGGGPLALPDRDRGPGGRRLDRPDAEGKRPAMTTFDQILTPECVRCDVTAASRKRTLQALGEIFASADPALSAQAVFDRSSPANASAPRDSAKAAPCRTRACRTSTGPARPSCGSAREWTSTHPTTSRRPGLRPARARGVGRRAPGDPCRHRPGPLRRTGSGVAPLDREPGANTRCPRRQRRLHLSPAGKAGFPAPSPEPGRRGRLPGAFT